MLPQVHLTLPQVLPIPGGCPVPCVWGGPDKEPDAGVQVGLDNGLVMAWWVAQAGVSAGLLAWHDTAWHGLLA